MRHAENAPGRTPRSSVRVLLCLALTAGALASQGCLAFCDAVLDVGKRHESAAAPAPDRSPILAAYADVPRGRLSLRYHVEISSGSVPQYTERWLNISRENVARAGQVMPAPLSFGEAWPAVFQGRKTCSLAYGTKARSLLAKHPAWDLETMDRLGMTAIGAAEPRSGAPALIIRRGDFHHDYDFEARKGIKQPIYGPNLMAYCEMDVPELGGPTLIEIRYPFKSYRTVGGYAAQGLLPAALVLDIVTAPVQIIAWAYAFGKASGT